MKLFPSGREPTHFEQRSLSSNSTPLLPPPRVIMRGVNHSCIFTHVSTFESVIYADRREGAQMLRTKLQAAPQCPHPCERLGPGEKERGCTLHFEVDVKEHLAKALRAPLIFRISSCIQIWKGLCKVSSRNLSGKDPLPRQPPFLRSRNIL